MAEVKVAEIINLGETVLELKNNRHTNVVL